MMVTDEEHAEREKQPSNNDGNEARSCSRAVDHVPNGSGADGHTGGHAGRGPCQCLG
jgi:hypothetical protein